jgi:hypothetical protein
MTTSGETDWSLTARDLIKTAMQEAVILPAGTEPTADELSDCLVRLNALLKSWETRGYTLWREETITVAVTAATNPTTLDDDVYDVQTVRYVVSATHERPLTPYDRDNYQILPNKTQTGNPSIYYSNRQRDNVDLYLWPVPAENSTVQVDYLRKIETVTDAAQTVDIPQDWQETVYVLLAVRICGMFGVPVPDELGLRAQILQREIDEQDRPAAYFMGSWNA